MKRKILFVLIIVLMLVKLLVVRVPSADFDSGEVIINNSVGDSIEMHITDSSIFDEISVLFTKQFYFRQPPIRTWSRNKIDYEINLYNMPPNRQTQFRILLNESPSKHTRYAYRSRLDVMYYNTGLNIFKSDFSVRLSQEQTNEILSILKQHDLY
jgi:hypothetical protein